MANHASLASLTRAMDFEREGLSYYSQALQRTKHPAAQAMFRMLVEEEEKHVKYLQNYYEKLKSTDRWPSEITISLDKDFRLLFKEEAEKIDENVKVMTDEIEALNFAIEMENKGMAMYLGLSESASNHDEKDLYAALAKWEEAHARYVEDFYNYFQDHGMFTEE